MSTELRVIIRLNGPNNLAINDIGIHLHESLIS